MPKSSKKRSSFPKCLHCGKKMHVVLQVNFAQMELQCKSGCLLWPDECTSDCWCQE